jgi:signal transduction histidine kinase
MDIANRLWRTMNIGMPHPQVIPVARLMLAGSALLLIVLEKRTGPPPLPAELLLISYLAFGGGLCWLTRARNRIAHGIARWEHWVDAAAYASLVMLHGATGLCFICPLFLSIVVASCRRGPASALAVTMSSTTAIVAWLVFSQARYGRFDLGPSLIAPIALLVLGGMIVHWDRSDMLLKRRLQFISGITKISNPRLGTACMISSFMEQLRAFYDADDCILLMPDLGETEIRMRRVDRMNPHGGDKAVMLPGDLVWPFLDLPPETAVVRQSKTAFRCWPQTSYFEYDARQGVPTAQARDRSEQLSVLLDTPCFLTVPLYYHSETIGRVFLTSQRIRFQESDIQFLLQVFEHFLPLIDNIRLVDRMATDACLAERKKIARDLHDSVIQPYVGLKLGIGSLRHKLAAGALKMKDIDRLIEVHEQAIGDLRRFVLILKGQVEQDGDLLLSIRQFVDKFTFATGISVEIDAGDLSLVDNRLAAEALQIVAEGLSNIRRHTESMKARIFIRCLKGQLAIRIEDSGGGGAACKPFKPWSISERAESLGGKAVVEPMSHGGSRVLVEFPL